MKIACVGGPAHGQILNVTGALPHVLFPRLRETFVRDLVDGGEPGVALTDVDRYRLVRFPIVTTSCRIDVTVFAHEGLSSAEAGRLGLAIGLAQLILGVPEK